MVICLVVVPLCRCEEGPDQKHTSYNWIPFPSRQQLVLDLMSPPILKHDIYLHLPLRWDLETYNI